MANFDFELQHELKLIIVWKNPPESLDEQQYRTNVEIAVQEMALKVQIQSEELSKPIVVEMVKRVEDLWNEYNSPAAKENSP